MTNPRPLPTPSAYDPNRLFDTLLRGLQLEDDQALSQRLRLDPGLLARVRRGEIRLSAALLIRISEHSGTPVAELRRAAGDRRGEVRLEDDDAGRRDSRSRQAPPLRPQTGLIRDDPGLPANVQWT